MDKLDKILDKIEQIEVHVGTQAVTLGKLTVSVEDHVRRTNLLEEKVGPIEKHINMEKGAIKLIGLISTLAAIYEAFRWMRH